MISFIRGTLVSKREESVVVETNHIGYEIVVPLSVLSRLPQTGSEVILHTELYVREDLMRLYGFFTEDDVDVFRRLIGVSGIGPKGAIGILSTLSPDALRMAIMMDDAKTISQAKGIGKKTAEKLIIELKDKIKPISLDSNEDSYDDSPEALDSISEAVLGLTSLGYSQGEALQAIKKVKNKESTSSILKEALQHLAKE